MERPSRRAGALAILAVAIFPACQRSSKPAAGSPRTDRIRPALLEWRIGLTDAEGPTPMVETVLPATFEGRDVWRVIHRDPDPSAEGAAGSYDMYDVDRATLSPLRSAMNREGFQLTLAFDAEGAKIVKREGAEFEETAVAVRNPMPEGPGMRVLVGAMPLREGFRTAFDVVDRWDAVSRVKPMKLTVARADPIETRLGRCPVLEVTIAARDGSFRIRQWVRPSPPHYPFRVEYSRGNTLLVSEVTRMVIEGVSNPCSR